MSIDIFEASENAETLYMELRDETKASWHKEAKIYWNLLYQEHRDFLDKKFPKQFPLDIISSLWELTLLDFFASQKSNGISMLNIPGKKKKSVPDFCFSYDTEKFYVEATCASSGNIANYPELSFSHEKVVNKTRDTPIYEYRERLTSAFKEKGVDKYEKSYKKIIGNDGFIIAISMAKIPFFHQPRNLNIDLSCFFSHSPYMSIPIYQHESGGHEMDSPYYPYQPSFSKRGKPNNNRINTDYFLNEKFSYISAILLSHSEYVFFPDCDKYCPIIWPKSCRNDFVLIHNPYAKIKLPQRLFPISKEVIANVDGDRLVPQIISN